MCTKKSETTATIINVLVRMKDCLMEAKKPLMELALHSIQHIFRKQKGNLNVGEEDKT